MKLSLLLCIVSGCNALAASAPSSNNNKFQLKYFDAMGAAEGIRFLFALAGEDYEDPRYGITPGTMESPAFNDAKASGDLVANLNRAPVLVTPEGVAIGQSKAIERFLARRFGFMGSDEVEAAVIDCISEHCRDVKDAQMRKRFSPFTRDRTDDEKAKDQADWFETELPAMLAKVEAAVAAGSTTTGYAVGSSISYADLCIFSMIREGFPAYNEATLDVAKDCPRILEICETCASDPKLSQWIETRPETNF